MMKLVIYLIFVLISQAFAGGRGSGGGTDLIRPNGTICFKEACGMNQYQNQRPLNLNPPQSLVDINFKTFPVTKSLGFIYLSELFSNNDIGQQALRYAQRVPWRQTNLPMTKLGGSSPDEILGAYFDGEKVWVQSDAYASKSDIDKAALILHETIRYGASVNNIKISTEEVEELTKALLDGTSRTSKELTERLNKIFKPTISKSELNTLKGLSQKYGTRELQDYFAKATGEEEGFDGHVTNLYGQLVTVEFTLRYSHKLRQADDLKKSNDFVSSILDRLLENSWRDWMARAKSVNEEFRIETKQNILRAYTSPHSEQIK